MCEIIGGQQPTRSCDFSATSIGQCCHPGRLKIWPSQITTGSTSGGWALYRRPLTVRCWRPFHTDWTHSSEWNHIEITSQRFAHIQRAAQVQSGGSVTPLPTLGLKFDPALQCHLHKPNRWPPVWFAECSDIVRIFHICLLTRLLHSCYSPAVWLTMYGHPDCG